jgi:hypothetical protein
VEWGQLAEASKEGLGSERAVVPMMMMMRMMMMLMMMMMRPSLQNRTISCAQRAFSRKIYQSRYELR